MPLTIMLPMLHARQPKRLSTFASAESALILALAAKPRIDTS